MLDVVWVVMAEKRMTPLQYREQTIPKFSVQLQYIPYPSTVDLGNRYDCNTKSLRKSLTDDVTTLLGCKELTVRCHHFDKDSNFHDNGDVSVIPKNAEPNEEYALSIETILDICNPFHGVWCSYRTRSSPEQQLPNLPHHYHHHHCHRRNHHPS